MRKRKVVDPDVFFDKMLAELFGGFFDGDGEDVGDPVECACPDKCDGYERDEEYEISEDDAYNIECAVSDRLISLLDLYEDFLSCNAVCSEWTPRRVSALLLRQKDVSDETEDRLDESEEE